MFIHRYNIFHNKVYEKIVRQKPSLVFNHTPKLTTINIDISHSCNLKCEMCFSNTSKTKYMSDKLFFKIMNDIKNKDVSVCLNFAGESLLHPNFDLYCKIASDNSNDVSLATNGTLIHNHISSICEYIDSLSISLDGLKPVNNNIRLGCDYDLVEKNIKHLMSKPKRPFINLMITMSTQSNEDVKEFVDYWINKVDSIQVKQSFDECGKLNKSSVKFSGEQSKNCPFMNRFLAILYDGRVTKCCVDLNGDESFTNLNEVSLYDAWNSSYLKDLRYSFLKGQLKNYDLCSKCDVWVYYNSCNIIFTNKGE